MKRITALMLLMFGMLITGVAMASNVAKTEKKAQGIEISKDHATVSVIFVDNTTEFQGLNISYKANAETLNTLKATSRNVATNYSYRDSPGESCKDYSNTLTGYSRYKPIPIVSYGGIELDRYCNAYIDSNTGKLDSRFLSKSTFLALMAISLASIYAITKFE